MASYIVGNITNAHLPAYGRNESAPKPCCARCRRGTKACLGPCGLTGCKCHEGETK